LHKDDNTYKSVTSLLMEPSFFAWFLKKNALYEQLWDKWIAADAINAQLAKEASELLRVMVDLQVQPVSSYQRNISFDKLMQKITEREKGTLIKATQNNFTADK